MVFDLTILVWLAPQLAVQWVYHNDVFLELYEEVLELLVFLVLGHEVALGCQLIFIRFRCVSGFCILV